MNSSATKSIRIELLEGLDESPALTELRMKAVHLSDSLGLPDKDNESWRKMKFGDLDLSIYQPLSSGTEISLPDEMPAGVKAMDLEAALASPALHQRIEEIWKNAIERDSKNIFRMMSLSDFTKSVVFHVTGQVETPVTITHKLKKGNCLSHLVIVIAEKGAELKLVEEHQGVNSDERILFTPATEIYQEANSHVKHISLRNYTGTEAHFHSTQAVQKDSSTLNTSIVQIGGFVGKSFYRAKITEPHAEFRAIGVAALSGVEFADLEMLVEHEADNTFSNLRYRTVLKDGAHHVFNGNLHIPPGKRNVDALQVNNNIILSKRARAESQPNLVTKSESVSCEHGATVGQLDEEAVYFLMARGIPEPEARNLLIQGFIDSIIEEIPLDEATLEEITKNVREKVSL